MKKRWRISIVFLIVLGVWILIAPMLANHLVIEKPLAEADVIFVMSGGATYLERTQKAAELYKNGIAPRILLTNDGMPAGWSPTEQRNPKFVELARKSLIEQGVAPEAIEILPETAEGTIYEAQILRRKLQETNWKRILIVTSAYHTRRALWTFERVLSGSDDLKIEIGIESAPIGQQTPKPLYWWLSPFGWSLVAGEYVKSFYYWVYY
jgi:uncharacterized SAM-binding protein YcdF (DUF218 family)